MVFTATALAACAADPVGLSAHGSSGSTTGESDQTGAPAPASGNATTTGLPCDVDAVMKSRCQGCHGAVTQYGATMSLVSWDDLQKPAPSDPAKKVLDVVKARIHAPDRPMPPVPNPLLAATELATLDAWLGAGTPASSATCSNDAANGDPKPLSCTPDVTFKAATKFEMPQDKTDEYVCVGVDVTLTKKRHVTALAPKIDNKTILHHILLFQSPQAESPTPTPCAAFGSASWKLVAGWAPGGNNLELPPEAGFPEEAGTTHWVLQLHYNNAKGLAGQQDGSGYDLCTTEELRANDAGVAAFGSTKFKIPPRSTSTVRCDYTLPQAFDGVKLFNASPHMHTRGTALSTERFKSGSTTADPIFSDSTFTFENQSNFPITNALSEGDVMRTRCTWKNPGDTTIGFGENTGDEMCFDFIGYYPNIPDQTLFGLPIFSWITPSATAKCTME